MADDDSNREDLREQAAQTDLRPPEAPDLSKFLTMSDFRVDFTKRRRAVFVVTGFMGVLAGAITAVILWCIIENVRRGQPVDPTLGNILSGLITALFINVAAVVGSYLVVPAWETSNFRKNFTDVIRTVGNTNVARTQAKYGGGTRNLDDKAA